MKRKNISFIVLASLYGIAAIMIFLKFNFFKSENSETENIEPKILPTKKVPIKKLNPYTKENKKVSHFFEEFFLSIYNDYYKDIKVRAYDYYTDELKNNLHEKWFFVEIQKTLKYDSVYDLPFVQGMQTALQQESSQYMKQVFQKKVLELEIYIGQKQVEYNCLKVKIDDNGNYDTSSIGIFTYHREQTLEVLKPPTVEQMQNEGNAFLVQATKLEKNRIHYNNAKAVKYAYKHTSNPIFSEKDSNIWNEYYTKYENDCANYVSQCLYAGGIKKTEYWYDDSLLWIRTGSPRTNTAGLTTYMQNSNKFFSVSHSATSTGGFICLNEESHVVLVTSNDSITILYNGHTNDRASFAFPYLDLSKAQYLTPNNF